MYKYNRGFNAKRTSQCSRRTQSRNAMNKELAQLINKRSFVEVDKRPLSRDGIDNGTVAECSGYKMGDYDKT
eukprot:2143484-Amphidinium_carterae.1